MKNIYITSFLLIISFASSFAQSDSQKKRIRSSIDKIGIDTLKVFLSNQDFDRSVRVNNFLISNPDIRTSFVEDNIFYKVYDIIDDEIIYGKTLNLGSSFTIKSNSLYNGGLLGLNLQGQGLKAGVWDGGSARNTHNEFPNNKVLNMNFDSFNFHATHVTGTVCAQGLVSSLRGIAFDSSVDSYNWDDDLTEMTNASSNGLLVSNHSYFIGSGGVWMLGAYDSRARLFDALTFSSPFYLPILAAGNDRNDYSDSTLGPYLNQKGGYNLIKGMANSKNVITVGAVGQVSNYVNATSVQMSDFSSWGPTDDGRIKPDVVAKGVNVRSTLDTSDTASGFLDGTSMASPAVTGVALLLQQHYSNLNTNFMRSSTLKGLILHTARESGSSPGPDYSFGWGLVNAESAANLITNVSSDLSLIQENLLLNTSSYSINVYSDGNSPLLASICWTDRPGTANNTQQVDPVSSNLINDLDIRIFKDGVQYFPWTLDPANPFNPAVQNSDNFRDNYERVEISTPTAGVYQIVVSHKGSLISGQQNYTLIVSGINQSALNNSTFNANDLMSVYPNPANEILNIQSSIVLDGAKVEIFDMLGKNIYRNALLNNSIDISNFDSGIYMLNISTDEGTTYVKKFIKK